VKKKEDPKKLTNGFRVIQAGRRPPCLDPGYAFCRGCFGWQNMIDAATGENPIWRRAEIHCSETGLTVRLALDNNNPHNPTGKKEKPVRPCPSSFPISAGATSRP